MAAGVVLGAWVLSGSMNPAWAADLSEGVDQLAVLLGKSVGEGKTLRIAVTDLPDLQNVNSDLSRYIAERLTTRLSSQVQKFRVVERRRLDLVLSELKFGMSDLADPTKAKQLGRMLGVEGLVVGSIFDLGNHVEVDVRIIEVESSNLLPGVSTRILKDQVVEKLLSQGRHAGRSSNSGGPASVSPSAVTGSTQRAGVHPVNQTFTGGRFFVAPIEVVLRNIEIAEGRFLKFNFGVRFGTGPSGTLEVFLDRPKESAFLVDQRGRQHTIVDAAGISANQALRLNNGMSKHFALTFPLAEDLESFTYEATLFTRVGSQQSRIQIRSQKKIDLADFR